MIGYSLFISHQNQYYTEDDNDISIEDNIAKGVSFNCGIFGTTDVLVNEAALFGKRPLKKINFKIKTGAREKHEICWQ